MYIHLNHVYTCILESNCSIISLTLHESDVFYLAIHKMHIRLTTLI